MGVSAWQITTAEMYGVQSYYLLICDALGLNYAWYEAPMAHKNSKRTHTP